MSSALRRKEHYADVAEARRQLNDSQNSLADAIQNHDPEAISEARLSFAEARERLRGLTARGAK